MLTPLRWRLCCTTLFARSLLLVLDRSLGYRISPLDQLGQHRNDPFQVGLASHMPLGIDRIE
jgi:hypothetical protein